MKCNLCKTEMIVDHTEEKGDTEVFYYKCPNPKCANYGYGNKAEEEKNTQPE